MKKVLTSSFLMLSLVGCSEISQSHPSIANSSIVYACYLKGGENIFLRTYETTDQVIQRPDGTEVRSVVIEIDGRAISGFGLVNSNSIDAMASDPIAGDILLKSKMEEGVMNGRVRMMGVVKDIHCYTE